MTAKEAHELAVSKRKGLIDIFESIEQEAKVGKFSVVFSINNIHDPEGAAVYFTSHGYKVYTTAFHLTIDWQSI